MDNSLKIRCKNNNKVITAPLGSTLSEVYAASGLDMEYGPMAALVNNKVQGMNFRFYNNKDVEFQPLQHDRNAHLRPHALPCAGQGCRRPLSRQKTTHQRPQGKRQTRRLLNK